MYTAASKGKKAFKVFIAVILALLCVLTCAAAASPAILTPEWFRYGVYGAYDGNEDASIRKGSVVVTDRSLEYFNSGDWVLYLSDDEYESSYPMRHAVIISYGTVMLSSVRSVAFEKYEKLVYQADNWGYVTMFLYRERLFVWIFWGVVIIAFIVLEATKGARKASKARKKLLKTFEYYGKKYEKEDEDKDY